jgi:hypothetical protein
VRDGTRSRVELTREGNAPQVLQFAEGATGRFNL